MAKPTGPSSPSTPSTPPFTSLMPAQSTTMLLPNDDYATSTSLVKTTESKPDIAPECEPDTESEHKSGNAKVLVRAQTLWVTHDGTSGPSWFEDSYVKKEPLGEPGSFGMAFRCHKKGESEMFAVKQINKAKFMLDDKHHEVFGNMRMEIQCMQLLEGHPYICQLLEVHEERNYLFLVLELLAGGELYARIEEREEMSELETQSVSKQLFSAMHHMHSNNVAHLDLKPDNILFIDDTEDAAIKIIDFGEAQLLAKGQRLTQKIGTPLYMAPEMLKADLAAEGGYDPFAADIWSAGCILFSMLFGFPAFMGDDDEEIYDLIRCGFKNEVRNDYGPWFPADIPISSSAMDLIGRMLEQDPLERPTAAECLKHEWILQEIKEQEMEYPHQSPELDMKTVSISFSARNQLTRMKRKSMSMRLVHKPKTPRHAASQLQRKLMLIDEEPICVSDDEEDGFDVGDSVDGFFAHYGGAEVVKQGYLVKEGKLFRTWKRRFFELTRDGVVRYFYDHQRTDKVIGEFSVKGYTALNKCKLKHGGQHGIVLSTVDRNWKFVAKNAQEQEAWMLAFAQAGAQ